MHKLSITIALAALPALPLNAATLQQWRERPPRWQITSERSLVDLQGCLGSRWAAALSTKMQAMPIERGTSYVNDGFRRDILVDLTDDGDHRTIKLWLRNFMGITAGATEQIERLSSCAVQP
jgi:hypothetical protein